MTISRDWGVCHAYIIRHGFLLLQKLTFLSQFMNQKFHWIPLSKWWNSIQKSRFFNYIVLHRFVLNSCHTYLKSSISFEYLFWLSWRVCIFVVTIQFFGQTCGICYEYFGSTWVEIFGDRLSSYGGLKTSMLCLNLFLTCWIWA